MYEDWETDVLVKAIAHHTAEEKEHKATAEAMKKVLRKRLGVTDEPLNIADYSVSIGENKRFNAKKAYSLVMATPLDPEIRKAVITETVDSAKLKVLLPDLYSEAQDEGEHRVSIKDKED